MKKWLLIFILIIAMSSFFLFLTGFIIGANDIINPKPSNIRKLEVKQPDPTADDGRIDIVALGDSLTRGIGDSKGYGYFGRFVDLLRTSINDPVSVANLAVSGAKTPDVIEQLKNTGVQYTISQADMITITIGGNDLNPGFEQLVDIDLRDYAPDTEHFSTNIHTILHTIRTLNPSAPIYWLSLYNPFEEIEGLDMSSTLIAEWNMALQNAAFNYENVFIIPTFDLFQTKTKQLLSQDHFHPNDKGYQLMAERLLQKVLLQLGQGEEDQG